MEKRSKILKILIIIILLIIVILSVLYYIISNKNSNIPDEQKASISYNGEYDKNVEISGDMQEVNVRSLYYVMKNITEKYFENIKQYQTDTIHDKLEGEIKLTEEDKKAYFETLCALYDQEYINKVKNDQIQKNIKIYEKADNININKMYFKDINEDITIFVAEVQLLEQYKQIGKEQIIVAKVDKKNSTFGIIPETEFENIEEVAKSTFSDNSIEENTCNKYIFKNIDDVTIIEDFLEKYKNELLFNREKAYNLLDEEYKEKRFGDYETFSKYIENNKKDIVNTKFTEYLINNYEEYKEYVCKDKYENLYIFHETATMNYKMMLDTYTENNETFMEKYKTSNDQDKVMMNIDKVRQMLNARDYRTIFSLLDSNFKKMYFEDDEEQFEDYMRKYFPSYYTIEFGELTNETGVYIQKVTLKDMAQEEKNDLEKIFYIDLKDSTDFIMSFNVSRH